MTTPRTALTDDDIRTLVKGATPDERAQAARKVCSAIDESAMDSHDRRIAGEILRVMAADAAELVRRAFVDTLKSSPLMPRDIALALARDVEGVSLPLLTFSPAFDDDDLAEIVKLGGPVRQFAIAQREQLSRRVTTTLAEHGDEQAVAAACSNDNADFPESALERVIQRFEHSERVLGAVAYRQALPLTVSRKLMHLVGEQVRDHLIGQHKISTEAAFELAAGASERATVDLVEQVERAEDMKGFVFHLNVQGDLTPSLLLRALVHGHMTFFEYGVAELSGIPHHRSWLMIHDAGPLGLKAIYERAGLPAKLFQAFRAAIDTYHSMDYDGGARDRERFQQRMMQRFLTQPSLIARDEVEYLLAKIERIADEGREVAYL
jgi:uncharacterized protein (DUF2336 family)